MRTKTITTAGILAATATLALTLSACTDGGSTQSSGDGGGEGDESLQEFSLALIPGGPTGLAIDMAVTDGAFEAAGLDLSMDILESGPAIINGVIADQFDAGWAGTPPLLSAIQGEADLHLLTGGAIYTEPGPTSLVAMPESGITTWSDLNGKVVGTNAPRSVAALGILAAVAMDGGDPATVELVPLPWDQIGGSVVSGDIDAGSIFAPYSFETLANNPELVDLGDPQWVPFESPGVELLNDMFFTSNAQYDGGSEKYDIFVSVLDEYFTKINDMTVEEYQEAYGAFASIPAELAVFLPEPQLSIGAVEASQLEPYSEAMVTVGWTDGPVDFAAFLGG